MRAWRFMWALIRYRRGLYTRDAIFWTEWIGGRVACRCQSRGPRSARVSGVAKEKEPALG